MKLIAILLTVAFLQVRADGFTQATVTFSGKDVALEKVISAIKQQTGYTFFYTMDVWKDAKPVTISVKNATVVQVLNLIMEQQPFSYIIEDKTIIISKKKEQQLEVQKSNEAPPIDVRGRVVNESGEPVQATVTVKGTSKGTSTNQNGEFQLNGVDENAVLVITGVGIEERELKVGSQRNLSVVVRIGVKALDEVQMIAYGTTTKRFQTGNVATVKAAEIAKQPVQNPLLALEGRVPGLFITQNTGVPGGGVTVRIQGQNSIQSGNDPLYIVDGVPINSQLPRIGFEHLILGTSGQTPVGGQQASGNPLNYLNPSDIESIEILKDADATAIYGSRAANGAILITTKKGKAGKTQFLVNIQQGWGTVTRNAKMMNSRQYLDMRYEAYKNDGIDISTLTPNTSNHDLTFWDTTRYTNWQKELIGKTAHYTNVNTTLSGGTSTIQYLLGGTFNRETTVFPLPKDFGDQKANIHFNLSTKSINEKFKTQFSASYMYDRNQLPGQDLTLTSILLEPVAPELYNPDGSLNWALTSAGASTFLNPLTTGLSKYKNETNNLISNILISYSLLKDLDIKTSVGFTSTTTNDYLPTPLLAIRPELRATTPRSVIYGNRNLNSWIVEPQINYKKNISKGSLDALLGMTFLNNRSKGGYFNGTGYNSDQVLENPQAAATLVAGNVFNNEYRYNAIFGRINYSWQKKYLINLTGRRDGSTRFGPASRFHNFGSIGAGWIFSEENLLENRLKFLSFGKLRGSYGTTGNDQIPDYSYLSLYDQNVGNIQVPYQGVTSLRPAGLPNPYLEWEETKKLQLGIDLGFFNDRLLVNVTYAKNRSSNQLLPYSLPSMTGFSGYTSNFPSIIQNTSWEFALNASILKGKNFEWSTSINLTRPRNKLVSFPDLSKSSYASSLVIGHPLDVLKVFHFIGVDPATGNYMFESAKDQFNPVDPDDRTVLLSTSPKFYGGFQNNIRYKGFELSFLFQYTKQLGQSMFFATGSSITPGAFRRGGSNQPVTVTDRWQKPGDEASIQKVSTQQFNELYYRVSDAHFSSDAGIADASYIRLKNVSLSYGLPAKWQKSLRLENSKLYIQGQNLLTITNYTGLDPENRTTMNLPPLQIITVGVTVNF